MKTNGVNINRRQLAAGVVFGLILSLPAFAADGASDWRATYDIVFRWLNFLVLVSVIVIFAKAPIKKFLSMRKIEISEQINSLEEEKKGLLDKIDETVKMGEVQNDRLIRMKERIIADGERRKITAIESARKQGELMLEEANRRITHRIAEAKHQIKAELVDIAVKMANDRLTTQINEKDNQRLVDDFLTSVG
ncbi:MAG: hypothetical protein HKM93_19400 [Desulfobacteraceae bacterium]|nr:hypothetical protein [Desulfobacteraceae bacterium]